MRREVVARKAALDELRNSSITLVAGRLQGALGGRCGLPLCRYRIQLAACSWEPAPLRSLAGERGARGERVEGGSFTFGARSLLALLANKDYLAKRRRRSH